MSDIKLWAINRKTGEWVLVDDEHPDFIYGISPDEFKLLSPQEARRGFLRLHPHRLPVRLSRPDEFILKPLFDLQDATIEHRYPELDGILSSRIESAGDIFREITSKNFVSFSYINQKLRNLESFKNLTINDFKAIESTSRIYADFNNGFMRFHTNVEKLEIATIWMDFGNYGYRQYACLQSVAVLKSLAKWAITFERLDYNEVLGEIELLKLALNDMYSKHKV